MVRPDGFVAVVRAAAVYEHHCGHGALSCCPVWQNQCAGQLHLAVLHGRLTRIAGRERCVFPCRRCIFRVVYVVGRLAACWRRGGRRGGREEEAGDAPFGIEGDGHNQRGALKFQAFLANGIGRLILLLPCRAALQCACLHFQLLPNGVVAFCFQLPLHLRR